MLDYQACDRSMRFKENCRYSQCSSAPSKPKRRMLLAKPSLDDPQGCSSDIRRSERATGRPLSGSDTAFSGIQPEDGCLRLSTCEKSRHLGEAQGRQGI